MNLQDLLQETYSGLSANKARSGLTILTQSKGGDGFGSQDDVVFVPFSTAQRFLAGDNYVSAISI